MVAFAVILGLVAVFLVRGWMTEREASSNVAVKSTTLTTVVVARRTLGFGDVVNKDTVRETDWPVDAVPPGSFNKVTELVTADGPRTVLRTIQVNEPVLESKLAGGKGRASLSAVLEKGMRAVTIRVNDVVGVGGFVLPLDRVDVLVTRSAGDGGNPITDILLQNVKVLAIDQQASEDKAKPTVVRAVTLEVTPEQAQKLALASQVGRLNLALRGEMSTQMIEARSIRLHNLTSTAGSQPPEVVVSKPVAEPKPAPVQPKKVTVRRQPRRTDVTVIRGLNSSVETVVPEGAK
jgi:pilus assembly protein CpaB